MKKSATKKAAKIRSSKSSVAGKDLSSSKKSSRDWAKSLITDIWPQERDFFARPERYRYVRKLVPVHGCVFCNAEEKGVGFESLVVFQNAMALVMLNKYPYNSGHLLIVPRRHVADLQGLEDKENRALVDLIKQSTHILSQVYGCEGFNIGMNMGAVAGAGIPAHLHWHVVPRWAGDTNFFPLIAETKLLPETLEQTYQKILQHFKELK